MRDPATATVSGAAVAGMESDVLKQQRLQKLKEIEEQKRRQKSAKLGMLSASNTSDAVPKLKAMDGNITSTMTKVDASAPVPVGVTKRATSPPPQNQNLGDAVFKRVFIGPGSVEESAEQPPKPTVDANRAPFAKPQPTVITVSSEDITMDVDPSPHPPQDNSSKSVKAKNQSVVPQQKELLPQKSRNQSDDSLSSQDMAAVSDVAIYEKTIKQSSTSRVTSAAPQKESKSTEQELVDLADVNQFLFSVPPRNHVLHCRIIRRKDGFEKLYPQYELYLEGPDDKKIFLMSARKRKKSTHANYIIASARMTSKQKENVIGKVKSNFLGTAFTIYDNGFNPFKQKREGGIHSNEIRRELAADPNFLGLKGPRKMTVAIPAFSESGEPHPLQPLGDKETIVEKLKLSQVKEFSIMHNKSPIWNEHTQSFVLNFNGRVTMASVKNFQIVSDDDVDHILMQFGRVGDETFTMDFQYPLTPVQAFGIALSSFDAKLACE